MFSHTRSGWLLILSAVLSIPLHAQEFPPAKVAIINIQRAVGNTQEIKKAVAAIEVKYAPRKKTIEDLQKQMADIEKQAAAPNIQPDKEAQLRSEFTSKQKQLQRLGEDLQSDLNAEQQDLLGRTGRQMQDVVKKLAQDRGVDVVIDASTTLYFKPTLELTEAATAAYDKTYPPK